MIVFLVFPYIKVCVILLIFAVHISLITFNALFRVPLLSVVSNIYVLFLPCEIKVPV